MNTIITIGRQYGSGGREVGQKLAAHYGINCYDNELITKVAKESGFCPEIVQQQDERPTNSFLYNLVMDACVIIGRCADCALQDFSNVINLFFHASEEFRIARAADYPDVPAEDKANPDKLREYILRKDKQRQSYYNYYSMKKWGRADTYDLSIDTGLLGIDGTVNLLTQVIEDFENR